MIKNWFQTNQHEFIIPTIRPWASYLTSPRSSLKLKSLRKKLLFFEHNNEINNKHLEEDAADVVVVHIVKDLLLRQRPDLQVWVFVVVPLVMMVIMSDGEDDEGGNRDDDDCDDDIVTWSPHSSMMFCSKHAVSAASMQPQYKSG